MCTHTKVHAQANRYTHKNYLDDFRPCPLTLVFPQLYADGCELVSEEVFAVSKALCLCTCVCVCVWMYLSYDHISIIAPYLLRQLCPCVYHLQFEPRRNA